MIKNKKGSLGGKAVVAAGIIGAAAGAAAAGAAMIASDKKSRDKAMKIVKEVQVRGGDMLRDAQHKINVEKKDAEKTVEEGKSKAKTTAQKKIKAL